MCLNLELIFFRVSSLAYPNLLGKKGYVVVVVVVVVAYAAYGTSPFAYTGYAFSNVTA